MRKFQVPSGRNRRTDTKHHSVAKVTEMSSQTEIVRNKRLPVTVLL